jgi:hypothetical protein
VLQWLVAIGSLQSEVQCDIETRAAYYGVRCDRDIWCSEQKGEDALGAAVQVCGVQCTLADIMIFTRPSPRQTDDVIQ